MHLVVIHTHPIQYQVPLYRMLHAREDTQVTALFFSDHSVTGGKDRGFGQTVKWDIPLLEGYDYRFLTNAGPGNSGSGFRSYRFGGFGDVFEELKPDAILLPGHGYQVYWQAATAGSRMKIPLIVRPESLDGAQPKRKLWKAVVRDVSLRYFYGKIDGFCATGSYSRKDAQKFGFADELIFNAPYCIDTELLEKLYGEAKVSRESVRAELGVTSDQLVAIFMAKFIDWKNPSLILDALETLADAERSKVFPLLVGSGPDFERVSKRATELTGNPRCCPGFVNQSELAKYYAAADCAVLPSKRGHESWGLVVNEAMTCGLPVAVSDGVGSRVDLVIPYETGAIFEDGDASALGEILLDWQVEPEKRLKMGEKAKKRIQAYSSLCAVDGIRQAAERVTKRIHY